MIFNAAFAEKHQKEKSPTIWNQWQPMANYVNFKTSEKIQIKSFSTNST